MKTANEKPRIKARSMRVLAGAILAGLAVAAMPLSAKANTPPEQRSCMDEKTPNTERVSACSFVIKNARPSELKELARLYFIRGNANLALKSYDQALFDFDAATMADPAAYGPFNSRGLVFVQQKQFDRAITEFDESIRLNPKDPVPLVNRGDAYRQQTRFDRALQDYDSAIVIDPKRTSAIFGRALTFHMRSANDFDALLTEGRYEELAIAEYGKVLQIAPRSANVLDNRGMLYRTLRKYDLAIADFTLAIEVNPNNAGYLRNRALTYRMTRRFDLAIADYRKALAVTQDDAVRKLIVKSLADLGVAA